MSGQSTRRGSAPRRARLALLGPVGLVASAVLASTLGAAPGAWADPWTPSSWTGIVAGAPVPGTGLPGAVAPAGPANPSPVLDLPARLEEQAQCDAVVKPGTQALANLIKATYPGASIGLLRNCSIGDTSEHKDGRAVDWMVSVRDPQQRANAEAFLNWLLAADASGTPYANARRLGVMYIGWHDRIWRAYDVERGWSELKGCFAKPAPASDTLCHRNHVHISLSWDGASGLTSFWDGSPVDGLPCRAMAGGDGKFAGVTPVGDRIAITPFRAIDTRAGVGVPTRCRLASGPKATTRISTKVLGVGGIPATGVTGAVVRVSALTPNAPAQLSAWSSGQPSPQVVANTAIGTDVAGEAVVPVAADGSIGFVVSQGESDLVVEVLGYVTGSTPDWTPVPAAVVPATASTAPAPGAQPAPVAPANPAAPAEPVAQPPAPVEPPAGEAVNGIVTVGTIRGYASSTDRPLRAGEQRALPITGLSSTASHALVVLTTKRASSRGILRFGAKGSKARISFPSKRPRSTLLLLPVSGGTLAVAATKRSGVSLQVDLLGYSLDPAVTLVRIKPRRLVKTRLDAGVTQQVKVVKGAGRKHVRAVVLRVVTAKAKGPGTVRIVGGQTGGLAPQAAFVAGRPTATTVLAPLDADGTITLSSDAPVTARVVVIGLLR